MASESMETKEEFHLFGAKESPLHPHHKSEFHVDGVKYNFIEQYVLHKKAEMCKSTKDAAELMRISDPNHLSKFDKKFIVSDTKVWEAKLREFMKKGYLEKSRQVKALFDLLEDTRGKILVYASRKDSILGIGVDANDPLSRRRSNWKGTNLLGDWLMEVREELPDRLESSFDDISSKQESTDGSTQHKETVGEEESQGSEKFTFFWKTQSPFSQWHPCSFVIDDQWYNCAEQYMMHQKAVTFGDYQTGQKVLKSKDPKEQKHLGRKVSDFDDEKWSLVAMNVVKKGNLAKFGQSEKLKGLIFETAGTTLVEASPLDNIWGIGLDATDPRAKDRSQWLGKNQLGEVLTEVREELMRLEKGNLPSKDGERSVVAGEKDDAAKRAKRKADDLNPDQKTLEGTTDAKVPKGPDPSAVRKDTDQRKGDSQGTAEKKDRKERPNSSQRRDRKVREEKNSVEMRPKTENSHVEMSTAESATEGVAQSGPLSRSHGETPKPVEKMECSDTGEGNEEVVEMGDAGWRGFSTMEVDIEEDEKEKKKRERSKDDRQERSDKERALKKGKTGYGSRNERDEPAARSKFDDKASPEKFTFFWRADSPFSQHHPANFIIDSVHYNCAEQFMMHQKAVVFRDEKIGWEIMNAENPAKQKSLAKQVEGFDEVHWRTLRRDVVKRGNIAKFSQNPRLRRMLFATAGTTMVEASPVDSTWGIALNADDPKAWQRRTWSGGNLLGEILTEVREELREKFKGIQEDEEDVMDYKDFSQGNKDGRDEQYTIFWRPVSPFHPRYPVGFELDNQFYQTLQQYLLHEKALFFDDGATARAIMENSRPNKLDELGRNIRNYDHNSWSKYCRSYLRLGNFAKFSQNPNVAQQLFDNVRHGELVYAAEEDSLLGVGLKEGDGRLFQRKYWKGKNLLGRALMEVRDMLLRNDQTLPAITEDPDDEVVDELPNSSQEASEHRFQFFFTKSPFNQWHLCRFKVGNIQYNSVEQYMLHQMALHFRDQLAAEQVLSFHRPRDMQDINIRNYDERNWEKVCREIILKGNRAKFTQDHNLREDLLKTDDSFLAYASTKDVLLGIGLRDTDPLVYDQQNWPGYNILGEVLMEVRGELKSQTGNGNNNSNGALRSDSRERIQRPRNDQPAEKFTFFWLKSPFSQWWKCSILIDGITYNCSEQYMMHQKALFFDDRKMAVEIMKAGYPSEQWQLGRQVHGYVNDRWNAVCRDIVKKGNFEKFSQHPRMRQQLFETAGTTLVEASPKDCKWGIGVMQNDSRAGRRETWLGENLLGQILTEVRDELMKEETDNPHTSSARNIPDSGPGRDRRGSERSDNSQGHRRDSDSNPKGFSHESSSSYEKSRFDHGGYAAGKPYQQQQHRDGGHQWSNQHSRPERGDTVGRPPQNRRDGGNERPQHSTRSFYGERPHAAEPRPYRDGHWQGRPMGFSSNQRRNSREEQLPVQEFKSVPSGQHSDKHYTRKTRSTPGGQLSQKHVAHDLPSVPADCSKVAQSDGAQDLPGGGCNADSKVVDGVVSNENFHIISEGSALSLWHTAHFVVDRFKYRSVGQYISHQKALRFNDGTSADEIMNSTSVTRIKKCEKYVDGFDERKWNGIYIDVVKDGNYFKFSQNEDLKQKLLATSGSHLVYADYKDRKLGVGLYPDDRYARIRKKWRGDNILGSMLMVVRDDLIHGRDSTKRSRDQRLVDQSRRNSVPESIEEDKRTDVQEQTADGDMKAVTSGDSLSFDKENSGAANSSCPLNKDRLENDAEAEAMASSAECEKDNVSEVQKPENLQKAANHEKESLQETAVLEKESLQEPAIPEKGSLNDSALPEKESLQNSTAPDSENVQDTTVPEKGNLEQSIVLKATSEDVTQEPFFSTDNRPGSKKSANKVVELSGTLEVQDKVEAVKQADEETELNSSQVTKDSVQTIDIPQSPRDDTQDDKNTTASETSASSENDEIAMVVPRTEAIETVAQPVSSSETERITKKDLEEAEVDVNDSVLDPASHDDKVSESASTSETEATSQNQVYDAQKYEDTQTTEPQALATDKILGTEKDENTAEPGAGKLSKDSLNGESHQEETVLTAADRNELEAQLQDITANTCQGTVVVKEVLIEKGNTEETLDSTKEDLADDIVNEIHQECTQTAGKTEALQVESGIEDTTQHASTKVKEGPVDESSTESQPEEAISASITENVSHEKISLKEEVDKEGSAEGCQEVVEKETLEVQSEDDCQLASVAPVDKSINDAEISKEKDVLVAERDGLGAQFSDENTIKVETSEELSDKSGFESHECVSTNANTEMLQGHVNTANTRPADVELTSKSEIKLIEESITEKPDDKGSSECCKQEENGKTLQEVKSVKEGSGDESKEGSGDESKEGSSDESKEGSGDESKEGSGDESKEGSGDESKEGSGDESKEGSGNESKEGSGDESKEESGDESKEESGEDSCQETEPVTEESDDRNEDKFEDKSSVEIIPGEASTPNAVKDTLTSSTEASCQETELVKDKLGDKTEAQLADESSVENIPDAASVPAALKEVLVTQTNLEKSEQEIALVKEELVDKVEDAPDDESSVESNRSEANSTVAEKEEVSEPLADVEDACPETSTKVEIDGTNSAEVEASQQATNVLGTNEDHPALTDLQTGERNSENETSQMDDDKGKIQTDTNPVHQVS